MLSLLLLQRIAQLFIILFLGWIIVKLGILRSEDSRVISLILLYVITPCVTIHAFQIQRSASTLQMMKLSFLAAIILNVLLILLGTLLAKPFRLDTVEKASVIYSNAGNFAIPIVNSIFGAEWVLYTSMFNMVQISLLWTHGRILISGKRNISIKDVFGNVNIIAIAIGLVLFAFQIQLPGVVDGAFGMVSDMMGPAAMLITGMLMADLDFKSLKQYRRIWKPVLLRLVVVSFLLTALMKYSGLAAMAPYGETVLLISLMSTITPSANSVTQFCQMFGQDARYSSLINAVSLLLCIITIPLLVAFYQL